MINLKQREILKAHVMETTIRLATDVGVLNIHRKMLCEAAEIPEGSFTFYTGYHFRDYMCLVSTRMKRVTLHMPSKATRTSPLLRSTVILETAKTLHHNIGIDNITRRELAAICGISENLIYYYFGNMASLRNMVKNGE